MTSPSPLILGCYYHIFNRGVNRENIFFEERNYAYFLQLYAAHIEPVAQTFAYCLLKNHFHLLVRIKTEAELAFNQTLRVSETLRVSYPSQKFADLFNAYAKGINKSYARTGSLFQHPFGRVLITSDSQLFQVVAYIHQNPQKHHLVPDFRSWKQSSYTSILSDQPTRLMRGEVLGWFGGRQQYIDMHAGWAKNEETGWYLGDDPD
jgi:putative transposase